MRISCLPGFNPTTYSGSRDITGTFVGGVLSAVLSVASLAIAQDHYEAKVTVDTDRTRNVMAFRAVAADTAIWDDKLVNGQVFGLLHALGVTTLRYPGPTANRYHWATNKSTRILGTDPAKYDIYPSSNSFGQFAAMLEKSGGTTIVTVNYGSNQEGTGGGEPAEAAAWVAYANGDPADTKVIGNDSTGTDWKSVGYWATLRASDPLPTDDGLNFLRVSHPQPFKIKYWEIGNEVFANGYYMKDGQNNSEEDLRVPHGKPPKEDEKLRSNNSKLSPETYGNGVVAFAKAMKAVDPSIKVGAVLIPPPIKEAFAQPGAHFESWSGEGSADSGKRLRSEGGYVSGVAEAGITGDTSQNNWNPSVLKACGGIVDFGIVHWKFGKNLPPDWKTPDKAGMLAAPFTDLPQIVGGLLAQFNKYGGANAHNIQLAITGIQAWGLEKDPLVQAFLIADSYASMVEDGTLTVVGASVHDAGFLDESNKPGPLAYAVGMVHIVARPNDPMLQSESSNNLLAIHSAKRADGTLGLMLINKDPAKSASVRVNIKGGKVAASGLRFDFGKATNGVPVKKTLETSAAFTIEVPPYTITDVVLPKAQ